MERKRNRDFGNPRLNEDIDYIFDKLGKMNSNSQQTVMTPVGSGFGSGTIAGESSYVPDQIINTSGTTIARYQIVGVDPSTGNVTVARAGASPVEPRCQAQEAKSPFELLTVKHWGRSRVILENPNVKPSPGQWGWLSTTPGRVTSTPQTSGTRWRVCQFLSSVVDSDGTVEALLDINPGGITASGPGSGGGAPSDNCVYNNTGGPTTQYAFYGLNTSGIWILAKGGSSPVEPIIQATGSVPNGASIPTKTQGATRVLLENPGDTITPGTWGWLSTSAPGKVRTSPQTSGTRYRVCQFLDSTVTSGSVKAWINIIPQGMVI